MPDSVTQILKSGPPGMKKNIAVLGDGFATGDQTLYNNKVKELLLDGVFGHDYFYEDAQAFNIFRVNLISNDSGVSQRVYDEHGTPSDPSDDTIVNTTLRDTPLGYIFSWSWAHCWLENGTNTSTLVQNALNTWVPDYDLVLIILNEAGFGGCGGGGFQIVTLGSNWTVMAHEFVTRQASPTSTASPALTLVPSQAPWTSRRTQIVTRSNGEDSSIPPHRSQLALMQPRVPASAPDSIKARRQPVGAMTKT
jgi:IgA Peptidase M64